MKLSEHKDLKKEILLLSSAEKDKLLLRLIAKDKILTEHLHFLLLEDSSGLTERVEQIKSDINSAIVVLNKNNKKTAKDVLAVFRKLAKLVNHNLKVTKANFEDVDLRIFLYMKMLESFDFKQAKGYKDYTLILYNYLLKSVQVTINKFRKLHEDLQFDLSSDMNKLLGEIYQSEFKNRAIELNIYKNI